MNKLELRELAERVFALACNYPANTYGRPMSVPSDERRLRDIEEELQKALFVSGIDKQIEAHAADYKALAD